jgi:hypothetical protein
MAAPVFRQRQNFRRAARLWADKRKVAGSDIEQAGVKTVPEVFRPCLWLISRDPVDVSRESDFN